MCLVDDFDFNFIGDSLKQSGKEIIDSLSLCQTELNSMTNAIDLIDSATNVKSTVIS